VRALLACLIGLHLTACNGGPNDEVEMLRIVSDEYVISLVANGELRAAESTPIKPPPGSHNPRTISWMAPNHSAVKQGDVIARFDASGAEQGALKTGIELTKVDIKVIAKQRELERLLSELGNELDIVDIEKVMAEQFKVEDSLAYSRYEIIDATRDQALLEYRAAHLEGKKDNYSDRQSAEVEVLDAMRTTQEIEHQEHQQQIDHSEVRAPHNGFIVYEKNWWGLKVGVGSSIFPSNNIARIPNLDKMEAVLQVLETEAVGLAPGQRTDLRVDAYPDRPLTGEVKSISATAMPIARDSPVKFFIVIIKLNESDPEWITPDAQVTAEIHISRIEDTIAIPNQSLFQDETGDWVLVRNSRDLEKRSVKLGLRGANRSQVLSGLEEGDDIALYPPDDWKL
jgi:multidrug efflux pump subunit AcrA (membrane-fusion protein)